MHVKYNPAQPKITHQFIEDKEPSVVQEAKPEMVTVEMTPFLFEVFVKFCWNTPCAPTDTDYNILKEAVVLLNDMFGKNTHIKSPDIVNNAFKAIM